MKTRRPKEVVMNPIRTIRRLACTLTGLAVTLAAAIAVAPAAFAGTRVLPGMFAGVVTASASAAAPGRYTTIDVPGATATFAGSVNDFGVVAGGYTDAHGVSHGFIDRRGVFTTVNDPHAGTAPGPGTAVHAINDHGVLGGFYVDAHGVSHGFIDRRGVFTTVNDPHAGTAKFQGTILAGINNSGMIDGTY